MEKKMTDGFFSTLPWRIASRKHSEGFYVVHGKDIAGNRELQIFKIHSGSHPDEEHLDRQQDNAEAIVTAINSTYGKGIDPSSVPDLLEAIQFAMNIIDLWGTSQHGTVSADHEGEMQALATMEEKFKSALAKSIIKQ